MLEIGPASVTLARLVQDLNKLELITETPAGTVISGRLVQFSKAELPRLVSPAGSGQVNKLPQL